MNVSINQTSWHGMKAWALENDNLRTVIVPDLGGKLVSLLDKHSYVEWLIGPGSRQFKKVPYGSVFADQDMSGWDEMFPTIVECEYPAPGEHFGAPLPDHGEVWALPWTVTQNSDGKLTLSVEGQALPYRLTRAAKYQTPTTLQLHYNLENLSQDHMPYMWASHPQFTCGMDTEIVLPSHVTEVCNVLPESYGWGVPETQFNWPQTKNIDGELVPINRVGPPSLKKARKFYTLPDVPVAWAGLVRQPSKDWITMEWDPGLIPYFGLWIDEGLLNHETVATPEPITGFYDNLAVAWNNKMVNILEPGATNSWTVTVRFGTSEQQFPFDY